MLLKNLLKTSKLLLILLIAGSNYAQDVWLPIEPSRIPDVGDRFIIPDEFKAYSLDESQVEQMLRNVPQEGGIRDTPRQNEFRLPMPDGTFKTFGIVNSPVMAPKLASKYPEIQTYSGYDINDPANTVRFDLTPQGFHALAFTQEFGTVYIDPYSFNRKGYYMVYRKKDFRPIAGKNFVCGVTGDPIDVSKFKEDQRMGTAYGDCTKRTYRIAIGATGEYTTFHGGTVQLALAAQVTTMNRVNGIYMREMAIFMEIVGNNDLLIYTNAGTDPYTNNNAGVLINEIQNECDNTIGSANYDIGHVFSTGAGGLAGLGVICANGQKARGVTGTSTPTNDPFDVDYVAHELGHQFGCNHTFNNSCGGNRNNSTAVEPGSGSTIMAYAGICPSNVQTNSDDHFHGISMSEMSARILSTSCAVTSTISNSNPVINSVPTGLTIPGATPFSMTADATDPDGDNMSYCWEQIDIQISTQPPVPGSSSGPNFRSNSPVSSPTRYFPNLGDLTAGNSPTWEVLADVDRLYTFRVSVRDNFADGGCTVFENATINVDGDSGPFLITAPNTSGIVWPTGGTEMVTWDVAGTSAAPVNCANVDILLSIDGGLTYPTTLASGVSNNGSANVTVPSTPSTMCRVMVVCSDNIFFDISDQDFEIQISGPDFSVTTPQNTITVCDPDDAAFTINVMGFNGFTDDVTLSATGVPSGATATFSPVIVTGGTGTSMLILSSAGVTPGTYTVTVEGTNGTDTRMVDVSYSIEAGTPGVVTLANPVDGSTAVSVGVALSWNPEANATSYDIEIATDAGFTNIIDNATGISGTSFTSQNLAITTTYYWRVRAVNSCSTANWSNVWSFTTENIIACSSYTTGPWVVFNPVPSACFNDCTPVSPTFEVFQNESYSLFNLAGGEEYTFEFCNGYDPATWEALITIAEFNGSSGTVVPGSEFAAAADCSLTFTVPADGDYIIIISDPADCGAATVSVDNGFPTLTCSGLISCCGATFTDVGGADASYFNYLSYTATMCPDFPGEIIEVIFSEFSVEENAPNDCWDYLTIYDGDNTSAPQIGGEYCDASGSPGTVTATNAAGCLTFVFFSDGLVVQNGWLASVTCISDCPDADGDGVCDADDQCPGTDDALIGTPCDDGDDCTVDDEYDSTCDCAGTFADADMDGVCDFDDQCPGEDDGIIGTPCDDGDDCTVGDEYDSACDCAGTFADADMDGVCDFDDQCPGEDDGIIGTPCDDGDDCTVGDEYDSACDCVGTALPDKDLDGICDAEDNCPNDPNPGQEDSDMNGIGDVCDCIADLILTAGQITGSYLFESSNTISSSELLTGNADVEYSAGFEIDLVYPFEITQGAQLHAYILGCDNSAKIGVSDQKEIVITQDLLNETLIFGLELTQDAPVKVKVYDKFGSLVKATATSNLSQGKHQVELKTAGLESGVYAFAILIGPKVFAQNIVITNF